MAAEEAPIAADAPVAVDEELPAPVEADVAPAVDEKELPAAAKEAQLSLKQRPLSMTRSYLQLLRRRHNLLSFWLMFSSAK